MSRQEQTPDINPHDEGPLESQDDYALNDPEAILRALSEEVLALRARNEQLNRKLELDPKTGLLNAVAFEQKMSEETQSGTLMLFDLDFFKQINEKFQYIVADERFLKPAAQALKDNVRHGDLAGRFGGEEFVIFLRSAAPADSTHVLKRIYEAINACEFGEDKDGTPIKIAGRTHLGASVGIVAYPTGADYKERLDAANALLNMAKLGGRNNYAMEGGERLPGISFPLQTLE